VASLGYAQAALKYGRLDKLLGFADNIPRILSIPEPLGCGLGDRAYVASEVTHDFTCFQVFFDAMELIST